MISKHTGGRCTWSKDTHTPEQGGPSRRQYRIPIKAALNGTAGAHTLKVVISPAEATANLRAAEYGYGVPGLTQPGKLVFLGNLAEQWRLSSKPEFTFLEE